MDFTNCRSRNVVTVLLMKSKPNYRLNIKTENQLLKVL